MTQQLARDHVLTPEEVRSSRPRPRLVPAEDSAPTDKVVLYGDFTSPRSYLASRRAAALAADGLAVDWRAVQGPRGEAQAAVSAYVEAYVAGSAEEARHALFSAFWLDGVDLSDARLLRLLLLDAVRWDSSPSDLVRDWGYVVDNTGGPVSASAWRCIQRWTADLEATGTAVLPVLLVDEAPIFGAAAVEWLGAELRRRGLDDEPDPVAPFLRGPRPDHELAPLSWVSEHGNRWMRDYQRAFRAR